MWDIVFDDLMTVSDVEWNAFVADFDRKHIGQESTYESEFKTRTPIQQQEEFDVSTTNQLVVAA